jgi:hypothetical protein
LPVSLTKQNAAAVVACLYCAAVLWLDWWCGELTYASSHPDISIFYNVVPLVPTVGFALVVRRAPAWASNVAFYLLLLFVALGAARIAYFALAAEDEWVLLVLVILAAWESGALLLLLIGWVISMRVRPRNDVA